MENITEILKRMTVESLLDWNDSINYNLHKASCKDLRDVKTFEEWKEAIA